MNPFDVLQGELLALRSERQQAESAYQDRIAALVTECRRAVGTPIVRAGQNLQAFLDVGGAIELEPGASFEAGRFVVRNPTTVITGTGGNRIHGLSGPAFYIPPGIAQSGLRRVRLSSAFQAVAQFGVNGSLQSSLDQVPRNVLFDDVHIESHAHTYAKNGIENNAAQVELNNCSVTGVFNPTGIESHCVITINTPGGLVVRGGTYSGASTALFTGGDAIDIPDTDIGDVIYEGLTITKPLEWQTTTDSNKNLKNLIEFKNVTNAIVQRCHLFHNWGPIQRGFAVMLTPKVDGRVVNVTFADNVIEKVGGGFNITGRNPTGLDLTRTDGIAILRNRMTLSKALFGPSAYGWPMLLQMGIGRIRFEDNVIEHDGNALVYVDDRERIASLIVRGNTANVGAYGIKTPFGNNGDGWQNVFDELVVEGNTFSGATAVFRRNFPNNTYV